MKSLSEKILEKIEKGEVHMRPRWQFILRGLLWITGTIVVAILTIYLASFVLFALRENGLGLAPSLGWQGVMLFIVSSPWILFFFVALLLVNLYVLVRHYSFSYKKPLLYSIIGITVVVLGASVAIHQTPLHANIHCLVSKRPVPGISHMYTDIAKQRPRGVAAGTLQITSENTYILTTETGDRWQIVIGPGTQMPPRHLLQTSSTVVVFGKTTPDGIQAFGIKPIQPGQLLRRSPDRAPIDPCQPR